MTMTTEPRQPGTAAGRPGTAAAQPEHRQTGLRDRVSLPRVPAHVAVMLGLSASTYAVFLAGTTALQAANDTAVAVEKAPIVDALTELVTGHDRLEASLEEARARYGEASAAYEGLVAQIGAYEARIADLGGRIDRLQADTGLMTPAAPAPGAAAAPGPTKAPARTTAGSGTTGTTSSGATTPVAPPAVATPAPKPKATAVTGASVKK